ncbi:MAG: hypothetical protein WBC13_00550 [Dokdonella sp.]
MNFQKKIETKSRVPHFQQGGNIAIGSPKPYTTTLPGINFSPLTLNNAPIEINTTGLTDQINKMRDLSFKREELAFKYKELEYKEGKEDLDLLGDIYKGIGSVNGSVQSMGGIAAVSPAFKDAFSQYNTKKTEYMDQISRAAANKDFKSATATMQKMAALETDPTLNTLKVYAGAMNQILEGADAAKGGGYGIGTKKVMGGFFDILNSPAIDHKKVTDLIQEANYYKSLKLKVGDETKFIDDFIKPAYDKAAEKEVVSINPQTGISTKTITKVRPDVGNVKTAMRSRFFNTPEGKAYLESKGFNPDNPNDLNAIAYIDSLVDAQDKILSPQYAPSIEQDVVEKLLPNWEQQNPEKAAAADAAKELAKQKAGVGGTEKQYEVEFTAAKKAVSDKWGDEVANDPQVIDILRTEKDLEKRNTAIEKRAKELGVSAGGEGGYKGKTVKFGFGKNIKEVPATIEGIKKGAQINEKLTKFFSHEGRDYMVTADEDMQADMDDNSMTIKAIDGEDTLTDSQVNAYFKKIGVKDSFESYWFGDNFAKVYELETKPKEEPKKTYPKNLVNPLDAAKQLNSQGADNQSKGKFWSAFQDSLATNPNFKVQK